MGYFMTWDVDSRDRPTSGRLQRFVFGYLLDVNGRLYRYPGFVERQGVQYVGQSVLFVTLDRLTEIRNFLHAHSIAHVVVSGSLGAVVSR